ncbi:MAG: TetR/AcrR family transcriptional regulator [Crocinitomicaceae bacterium]|nr:TetR/AcrR family transcriptional regulator [Crocinitomicaceae bacterium]MBK8924454.1 TetR/AcrR family transcriptional regulator [Crocinitomicaceae bacterium]
MEEKKREIIEKATAIYLKYGIKSMTMDEMAKQLGISKKTLYSFVSDKNELVELCVLSQHEGEVCRMAEVSRQNENAIDEMLGISKSVTDTLKKIHPSIFFDLAKYHPNALRMMNEQKRNFIRGCVMDNLERGIKQGLYRNNLNTEVISTIYLATLDHIMLGDLFPESLNSIDNIYREFFRYHVRGIASSNGIEYLNELIKNDENF